MVKSSPLASVYVLGYMRWRAVSSRVRCEDSRGRFENFLGSTYRLPDPGPGVSDSLVLEKEWGPRFIQACKFKQK